MVATANASKSRCRGTARSRQWWCATRIAYSSRAMWATDSGQSWKQVVNDVVRAGVALRHARGRETHRVRRTKSVSLGRPLMADVSNVHETLSLAGGDVRG